MDDSLITSAFKSNTKVNAQWRHEVVNHTYRGNYVVQNVSKCVLNFVLPDDMEPPVLFYYRLTNFYQNHRRYVASFYDKQLLGDDVNTESSVSDSSCTPLTTDDATNLPYYPCGLIANSMFNDTFFSPVYQTENETYVMQNSSDIAWSSDNALYGNLPSTQDLSTILPPPNWQRQYPDGKYTTDAPPPDLKDNQAFQVWMRTAGLPTFSKLYMRNDSATMKSGTYEIQILSGMSRLDLGTDQIINMSYRIPDNRIPGHQVNRLYDQECYWRQEPLLGYCLCCGRWYLHRAGCHLHSDPLDPSKVSTLS